MNATFMKWAKRSIAERIGATDKKYQQFGLTIRPSDTGKIFIILNNLYVLLKTSPFEATDDAYESVRISMNYMDAFYKAFGTCPRWSVPDILRVLGTLWINAASLKRDGSDLFFEWNPNSKGNIYPDFSSVAFYVADGPLLTKHSFEMYLYKAAERYGWPVGTGSVEVGDWIRELELHDQIARDGMAMYPDVNTDIIGLRVVNSNNYMWR